MSAVTQVILSCTMAIRPLNLLAGATNRFEYARAVVHESLKSSPRAWFWFGDSTWLVWMLDTFGWKTIWVKSEPKRLSRCVTYISAGPNSLAHVQSEQAPSVLSKLTRTVWTGEGFLGIRGIMKTCNHKVLVSSRSTYRWRRFLNIVHSSPVNVCIVFKLPTMGAVITVYR